MPARLTDLNVPATVIAGSGPITITPEFVDPDRVITWTGTDQYGASVSGTTAIHENITLSVDPADRGRPGYFVLAASASDGTPVALSVDPQRLAWESVA